MYYMCTLVTQSGMTPLVINMCPCPLSLQVCRVLPHSQLPYGTPEPPVQVVSLGYIAQAWAWATKQEVWGVCYHTWCAQAMGAVGRVCGLTQCQLIPFPVPLYVCICNVESYSHVSAGVFICCCRVESLPPVRLLFSGGQILSSSIHFTENLNPSGFASWRDLLSCATKAWGGWRPP